MPKTGVFELFLDESGDFQEALREPTGRPQRRFASQLVGLLAPDGLLTSQRSNEVLAACAAAAGRTLGNEFHATECPRETVQCMVGSLLPQLQAQGWQPVRLVNRERVQFADRVTTYTNLVAELVLRCCTQLAVEGFHDVDLRLRCAGVWDTGREAVWDLEDYLPRIQETLTRAAIRAGRAAETALWRCTELRFLSGKRDRQAQLRDLLSNASHDDFCRLDEPHRAAFKAALGDYAFSLDLIQPLADLRSLEATGAYGSAILEAAAIDLDSGINQSVKQQAATITSRLLHRLASLGGPARDLQLLGITQHVDLLVHQQRDSELGRRLVRWLTATVANHLRQSGPEVAGESAWFEFQLHLLALAAANHLGDLGAARSAMVAMDALQPALVQRWEHLDRFLLGQILRAVHLTDCREFGTAIETAERVASFHDQLAPLFQAAMPDAVPAEVRSRRHGEALGTELQARMHLGLSDPSQFEIARKRQQSALDEFHSRDDRSRQWQYRCQLETLAGNLDAARSHLATALGLPEASAQVISTYLMEQPRELFPMLHWLRLGAAALRRDPGGSEARMFVEAWHATRLAKHPAWERAESGHPIPSLWRYRGELCASAGDIDSGLQALRQLRERTLGQAERRPLMRIPLLGLQTHLAVAHAKDRFRLLDHAAPDAPGVRQLAHRLASDLSDYPAWHELLVAWRDAAAALASGNHADAARRLVEHAVQTGL